MPNRCPWPGEDPLMIRYHDREWGMPLRNDRKLFEFMVLDAFQAGLSWRTVLHKRKNFEKAFDNFDPAIIAKYTPVKIRKLLNDAGIIRNRLKINGTVKNAKAYVALKQKHGSFSKYLWQFTGGKPKVNHWKTEKQIPARSKESDAMSVALKEAGFTFVGSTICYAFMQAAGMVNDHLVTCPRYKQVE
ncbi:MAG: DNA-3-methyladenine glycosylase I [Patescibacteria group bacterium]